MNELEQPVTFGEKLLNHCGLMTPVLNQFFGTVSAQQLRFEEDAHTYRRASALFQQPDDNLILEASLVVSKLHLPASLIESLRTTDNLFGQLLADYNIEVQTTAPELRLLNSRWSRDIDLLEKATGELLCSVHELLVEDRYLLKQSIIPQESKIT